MNPLVSICMPHLNSRPFTEERMETILSQTLGNWELIILDSNSDDGSREILQRHADKDPRVRIVEGPRDGIYTNLNRALQLSSGEYVYIATSDDTMVPDCLERMVEALEQNRDCGVCQCALEIINADGTSVAWPNAWANWQRQRSCFAKWIDVPHLRRAPYDGFLHFALGTVYTSLTQLLIRRRIFQELGLFRTDYSPHSDFEWGMRVGLNENIVYIPEKLASWRQHDLQATRPAQELRFYARGDFSRLVQSAIRSLAARNPKLGKKLRRSALNQYYWMAEYQARRRLSSSKFSKFVALAGFVLKHPIFSARWRWHKLFHQEGMVGDFNIAMEHELAKLGLTDLVCPIESSPSRRQSRALQPNPAHC